VNARGEDYRLSDRDVHWVAGEVCNYKHVNVVACQRLAENGLSNLVFILEGAALAYELAKVCVSVRVAMGEIARIVIMFKFYLET
jgi:hypothetical protein